MMLTGIIRLRHEFLFTMKICIKSLIKSLIYANGVITFDVGPTPQSPPLAVTQASVFWSLFRIEKMYHPSFS